MIGPGFTLSQVWKELNELKAYAAFATYLLFHLVLMHLVFAELPSAQMGYILIAGLTEIMTVGLAVQVWLSLARALTPLPFGCASISYEETSRISNDKRVMRS